MPVRAMFVPSSLEIAMQGILNALYGDSALDTQSRDQQIRERHRAGERSSDLAREFGISPQRVCQIIRYRQKLGTTI
jgi:Mor family transcriptional regulator